MRTSFGTDLLYDEIMNLISKEMQKYIHRILTVTAIMQGNGLFELVANLNDVKTYMNVDWDAKEKIANRVREASHEERSRC